MAKRTRGQKHNNHESRERVSFVPLPEVRAFIERKRKAGMTMDEIFHKASEYGKALPTERVNALMREIERKWPLPDDWFTSEDDELQSYMFNAVMLYWRAGERRIV